MPDKLKEPHWARTCPLKRHDIALLRPGHFPKGERFESVQDVYSYSVALEASLRQVKGGHNYAETLQDCRSGYYICEQPYCPLCARTFRRWLFGETSRLLSRRGDAVRILNPCFETRSLRDLGSVDPRRIKEMLRKQMDRAGLGDAIAIGGIEAGYKRRQWVLHGHIAVAGANPTSIDDLRGFYSNKEVKRPFVDQSLKDRVKQLSYLLKFHTYHRPSKSGRTYPLKPEAALELVRWQSRYRFEDFLFLKGLRRRGARLEPR